MRNADYLSNIWDAGRRPDKIDLSREKAEWHKLEIIETNKGGAQDSKGLVEFKTYFIQEGEEYALHEISRFIKNNHRWYSSDGVIKSIAKIALNTDPGKNAPSSCESGYPISKPIKSTAFSFFHPVSQGSLSRHFENSPVSAEARNHSLSLEENIGDIESL